MYRNHLASHDAKQAALYSASVEERATVGCFLLIQEMQPEPSVKQYPVTERLESTSPAQSESQKPINVLPVL
jgi:hypothetical protein